MCLGLLRYCLGYKKQMKAATKSNGLEECADKRLHLLPENTNSRLLLSKCLPNHGKAADHDVCSDAFALQWQPAVAVCHVHPLVNGITPGTQNTNQTEMKNFSIVPTECATVKAAEANLVMHCSFASTRAPEPAAPLPAGAAGLAPAAAAAKNDNTATGNNAAAIAAVLNTVVACSCGNGSATEEQDQLDTASLDNTDISLEPPWWVGQPPDTASDYAIALALESDHLSSDATEALWHGSDHEKSCEVKQAQLLSLVELLSSSCSNKNNIISRGSYSSSSSSSTEVQLHAISSIADILKHNPATGDTDNTAAMQFITLEGAVECLVRVLDSRDMRVQDAAGQLLGLLAASGPIAEARVAHVCEAAWG